MSSPGGLAALGRGGAERSLCPSSFAYVTSGSTARPYGKLSPLSGHGPTAPVTQSCGTAGFRVSIPLIPGAISQFVIALSGFPSRRAARVKFPRFQPISQTFHRQLLSKPYSPPVHGPGGVVGNPGDDVLIVRHGAPVVDDGSIPDVERGDELRRPERAKLVGPPCQHVSSDVSRGEHRWAKSREVH